MKLHIFVLPLVSVCLLGTPKLSHADEGVSPLAERLSKYVAAFDMAALDGDTQPQLERVLDRTDISHGQKVLAAHDILLTANALEHLDMHGALTPSAIVANCCVTQRNVGQ